MHLSVEASLKKLRTSYIDIFYLHWWDYETSIEEAMTALHNLVIQGKVLYLVSGPPASRAGWPAEICLIIGHFRYTGLGRLPC